MKFIRLIWKAKGEIIFYRLFYKVRNHHKKCCCNLQHSLLGMALLIVTTWPQGELDSNEENHQ